MSNRLANFNGDTKLKKKSVLKLDEIKFQHYSRATRDISVDNGESGL